MPPFVVRKCGGNGRYGRAAPCRTRELRPHEERIGVVAVQAAQRATVEEHGHARTGAVNGGDELPRVNGTERALSHASQAFGTLQVRDLLKALNTRTDGAGLGGLEVLLAKSRIARVCVMFPSSRGWGAVFTQERGGVGRWDCRQRHTE